MNLHDIRTGDVAILDANILVYANQQISPQCAALLARCARGDVTGIVPMPMAAELMHALMLIEARQTGEVDRPMPAQVLAEKPDAVKRLLNYQRQMHEFLAMGLRIEPAIPTDLIEAMAVQREFGLLTNDALLVAIARRFNCDAIASADKAFQRLRGFIVCAPDDLQS
ncbi:type II toxin-antitoxin system VapC family toxin [bacterium]|nr:type II toxin-antitoxin system VapC family toxin [bacterium]